MKLNIAYVTVLIAAIMIPSAFAETISTEINSTKMESMKNTARIINTSRGGVIDEEALYDALKNGQLGGAALDVFEVEPATSNKLATLPNFISTPHMGAQTKEAQSLAANVIAEKIIQILRGVI